jgi:hypothetical protein
MKTDNSTGKDREFYEMGKKIFDRIPRITQAVPQIPQAHSSNRQWIGLTEGERVAIAHACGAMSADWLVLVEAVEKALEVKNA